MWTIGTLYSYTVHLVSGAFNKSAFNRLSIISQYMLKGSLLLRKTEMECIFYFTLNIYLNIYFIKKKLQLHSEGQSIPLI